MTEVSRVISDVIDNKSCGYFPKVEEKRDRLRSLNTAADFSFFRVVISAFLYKFGKTPTERIKFTIWANGSASKCELLFKMLIFECFEC